MTNEVPTPNIVQTLSGIAAILQAIAWPIVVVVFFLVYRSKICSLLDIITTKLAAATKLKAWQLEFETVQEIKDVVEKTGGTAGGGIENGEIPKDQLDAAKEIDRKLRETPLAEERVFRAVEYQIQYQAKEYERIRIEMPPSPQRTRKMNEVAGRIRSLSLAGRPLLHSLMKGKSAGERLAAICFLQVTPKFEYFTWLIDRIMNENQAFLLYQAAVAVLELVRTRMYPDGTKIKEQIERAMRLVSDFKGGRPDQNTIDVLNEALRLLR
jgi:hypothetical protein